MTLGGDWIAPLWFHQTPTSAGWPRRALGMKRLGDAHGQSIERYPPDWTVSRFRHGWTSHHDPPREGREGLSLKKFTTFARVLREYGYSTVIGGKWQINHLGKRPNSLWEHGFDEHCVWPGAEAGKLGNPWKILESLTSSQWSKGKGNLWSGLNQWVSDGFHAGLKTGLFSFTTRCFLLMALMPQRLIIKTQLPTKRKDCMRAA